MINLNRFPYPLLILQIGIKRDTSSWKRSSEINLREAENWPVNSLPPVPEPS